MKPILATAIVILSSLLTSQGSAATQVEATLTLPYDHVLPGVPFDLVVTFTNVSDRPVTLGGALATLVVTFPGGETSVMHQPEGHDQSDIGPDAPLRLAPGEAAQIAASWEHGCCLNWFRYGSYSGPGTYGIALELQIADFYEEPLGTIRTAPVALTRVEPVGIDAELWKRMQHLSAGKWSDSSFLNTKPGVVLADEIIQLHPESGYYPYVLALRALQQVNKDHIPALVEAAGRFQSSPAYPYLLAAAANSARAEAMKAAWKRDAFTAERYFRLAETNYRNALDTKSVAVRNSSERGLRTVERGLDRVKKRDR